MIPRYIPNDFETLWSDAFKYATWMKIELEVCRVMEKRGVIPRGVYETLKNSEFRIDTLRIAEIERKTHHDVIAFLQYLEESLGEPARWLHFGLTSSDTVDTAFAILLRTACDKLILRTRELANCLGQKASLHKDVPMQGRTHGMHAQPTTFGVVLSGHRAEILRGLDRLGQARREICVGKISGAVGTYCNVDPEVEREVLSGLGLVPETVSTQVVARDRHAAFFCALALLAAGIERLATNVRHLSRTEVHEVAESFGTGQKGSSAMPHKRNPIVSENLCGLSRLVRSAVIPAIEDVCLWHERDISHSSVERVIAPDTTSVMAYMLDKATLLVQSLAVFPEMMDNNLAMSDGRYASEAIMLELIRCGMTRTQAYEIVQQDAGTENFKKTVLGDGRITGLISEEKLNSYFDADRHVEHAASIVNRVR